MNKLESTNSHIPIIFFDGFCILCNGFVDFIFKRDRKQVFHFASIQGNTAQMLLKPECIDALESIVYVDEEGCFQRSAAVLKILVRLGGFYQVFGIFRIVPRFISDFVYDFIARHRYRWFGKREACRVPTPQEKGRLLD